MVYKKLIIGSNKDITVNEYEIFDKYINEKVEEGEILRFSMSLEKGSKTSSKWHIQCVFEFDDSKFIERGWCRKVKELLKFNSVLMKSRKACCFQSLGVGQDFLLIACGYNFKDPNRKKSSVYGITDEEFEQYSARYNKLVERKENRSKMLFISNLLCKSVRYAKDNGLRTFSGTCLAMFNDGYNFSGVIRKIPDEMEDLFNDKLGIVKLDADSFMELMRKPQN